MSPLRPEAEENLPNPGLFVLGGGDIRSRGSNRGIPVLQLLGIT